MSSKANTLLPPPGGRSKPYVNDTDSPWVPDPRYPGRYRRRKDLGPVLGRIPKKYGYLLAFLVAVGMVVWLIVMGIRLKDEPYQSSATIQAQTAAVTARVSASQT